MGKPSAPPAPDYKAAAEAQGQANIEAARLNARLNNPNIVTPYGTQTVTYGRGGTFDEAAFNKAMQDYQSQLSQWNAQGGRPVAPSRPVDIGNMDPGERAAYNRSLRLGSGGAAGQSGLSTSPVAPTREQFTTGGDPDAVTLTQTLSPEQQKLLEQQNRISSGLGDIAESGTARVGQMLGTSYDPSALPSLSGSVDPMTGQIRREFDQTSRGVQYDIDPRFDQTGEQVQEALYRKQTSMLDPQYQQTESDLSVRLSNQGIMPGSEAYNREMNNFARNKQQAYESARDAAILAGGAEQSRLNELGLSRAGFSNTAQAQEFANNLQRAGFNNQAIAQMFGQNLSSAQFGNQARQQKLQEDLALRQLPLNEMNALRTGSQVSTPQFQQYSGGANAQPTNIMGATQAQEQAGIDRYNARAAQRGALTGGLFNLGSSYLLSDIRSKESIKRVGYTDSGLPVYTYRYKGHQTVYMGVMAQEIEKTTPDAVLTLDDGTKMVDYSKVT